MNCPACSEPMQTHTCRTHVCVACGAIFLEGRVRIVPWRAPPCDDVPRADLDAPEPAAGDVVEVRR